VRVISGTARGLKLIAPKGLNTRPTTDRIKESLFNIINFSLPDSIFLDLFSGSGAIGIEALSRGAKKAVFVDNSAESISVIEKNLKNAKLYDKSIIIKNNAFNAINIMKKDNIKFDIIFMDPPYNAEITARTIENIYNADILNKSGFIIAEQSQNDKTPDFKGFFVFKSKQFGKTTKMTFFKY